MNPSLFSDESRVKLYYFLGREFPKARRVKVGIRSRYVEGTKQALLAKTLRERIGRLDLGKGQTVDSELQDFILNAPDGQILTLLQVMVEVDSTLSRDRAGAATSATKLCVRINEFLISIGLEAIFDSNGTLLRQSTDRVGRMLDPLDARIRHEERVAIYYFLEEEFEPEQQRGMFEGTVGGEEQELLERELKKRLRRLELARGRSVTDRLKGFVTGTASPRELLVMLELMPNIRERYLTNVVSTAEIANRVSTLRQRILRMLAENDIRMSFTEEGKLVEVSVDKTPRALKALPATDALISALANVMREHEVSSVISMDLDEFKAVNDRYGKEAGDECLTAFVELAAGILNGKGQLYRSYATGDEFIALLPNYDDDEAVVLAERLRKSLEGSAVGRDVRVTASIGVAASSDIESPKALMEAAEEAMYASKFSGKNRVTRWPLEPALAERVRSARKEAKGR